MANALQLTPAALSPEDAAAFVGMGRSTLDDYCAQGLTPEPTRCGAKVSYCRIELEAWVAHGKPPRAEWKRIWAQILRDLYGRKK